MEEKPPIPENSPPPNRRPNRPAPMKPAARPRNRPPPGRLKKPPPAGELMPELYGVVVRLNGCAVPGAVEVDGGAEKVREPREPVEKPPPMRASAEETVSATGIASARAMATALTNLSVLRVSVMCLSLSPVGEHSRCAPQGHFAAVT